MDHASRSTPSILLALLLSILPTSARAGEGMVLYALEKGSTLTDDCPICGRMPIVLPLSGTFLLTLEAIGDVTDWYRVDSLDLVAGSGEAERRVSGSGSYLTRLGSLGEIGTNSMSLDATIDGEAGLRFESGEADAGAQPPAIDIAVVEQTTSLIRIYTLRLIAAPVPPPPFRRGDSNGDGGVDLSDAVTVLLRLYAGGEELPCLDAADADGSGAIDLTDAVHLLSYLFLSGQEPPDPGPEACGLPKTPLLGCGSYASC